MLTKEQAIEISREPDARLVDSLRARRLPSNTDRPDALSQQAADEIERLQKEQSCVCPKCGGRGIYKNGSFTLKE